MFISLKRIMVLIAVAAFVQSAVGQEPSAASRKTPAVIKFDGDMAAFLSQIGEPYGVTIGLEVDPQQPQSQVKFYLHSPTLAHTMNAIVESAPAYQWRGSGDFVEVLPAAGGSPLLDTKITYFNVTDLTRDQAFTQLMNLPETQTAMKATSLSFQDAVRASTETSKPKVSVLLRDVTVRQALSEIAKAEGGRFWIFRRDGRGSFTISISPR
jgi:hypothetical protein